MSSFPFEKLSRRPDLESPELTASDAADRLLLAELTSAVEANPEIRATELVIIGDTHGALTLGALSDIGFTRVRVHQDSLAGERALANNATALSDHIPPDHGFENQALDQSLVEGASVVVMRLPRSLDQLDQWASLIASYAKQNVLVLAGGRIKHMSLSMNDVLARYFDVVEVSLAVQKSRVLRAREPQQTPARAALEQWPKRQNHTDIELTVCAEGGAFAGTNIDIGTYDLLAVLDRVSGQQQMRIIDFGCGTGVLAAQIAKLRPSATVIASDQSAAAVTSAQATMKANDLSERVTVVRDDGLSFQPDNSADLILFNPPFHSGAAVHAGTSLRLFAEAGRVLKPGGELWVVANRHLSYKAALRTLVGETKEVRRTPKFTVTRSAKSQV